jgi:hypothetical protein
MEGKIMLDGSRGGDGLDLEGGTDVGQRTGAEGKRLRMVGLPALVFGSEVERSRVLEVGREDDRLVPSLTGELNPKIPGVEGDEAELEVFRQQLVGGKLVEPIDRVPEASCVPDVLPSQGGQARCTEKVSC